ncbi:MAG: TAXI family TRAP transporter solute-binding subunit [Pseudolabrys sp.]
MFGFSFKVLAATFCILGISWLALDYFVPSPPPIITIATASKGSSFEYFGQRYRERFARAGVAVELRETAGAVENLRLLEDTKAGVDIAFVTGDYSDSRHAPGLLSLGPIFTVPFWVFYSSTEPIDRLSQLKGKRIAVGPIGSGTRYSAERILGKGGVNSGTATLLPFAGLEAVRALKDGKVDAAWFNGGPDAPAVQALLTDPSVRLMDFPLAEAFTRIFPDLVRLVLPKGVIETDPPNPPNDVTLLGTTSKVLIRDDLHPAIVQLLSQTMKEEHSGPGLFQRSGEFPMSIDTGYPMAQIAIDYYKDGPSLLAKYLPFWLAIYTRRTIAVLIATLAIILPVFGFAPRLYGWFVQERLRKLYRRLRVVEHALQGELTVPQAEALQSVLADIDRVASAVPMRHSDLFFIFRLHLDQTRSRLALRLVEARSQAAKLAQGVNS